MYQHQDWKNVILRKSSKEKDNKTNISSFQSGNDEYSIEKRMEDGCKSVLKKIDKQKANLISKFRIENKLTREQLALLVSINVKDLASMECGTFLTSKPEYNKLISYINNYNIKQNRLKSTTKID